MTQDVGAVNLCVQMTLFSTPATSLGITENELIKVIVPFNEVAFYPNEAFPFQHLPFGYTLTGVLYITAQFVIQTFTGHR